MTCHKMSKSILEQFKVANYCCCLTKNLTHDYLVCQMCTILLFMVKGKVVVYMWFIYKYMNSSIKNGVL